MGKRTYKSRDSNIVNRNILSKSEHIKILAQLRPSRRVSYLSNILKWYKRRTLAKITPRLLSLSLPPKWKILNNWQYYQNILSSYRFERMVTFLLKNNIERFKSPNSCLCKKRIHTKNGESRRKLSTKFWRKNSEIFNIITPLVDFLLTPNTWILNKTQKKIFEYIISHLLDAKLWKYECKKLKRESSEMEFIRAVIKCTLFVSCILCSMNYKDLQMLSESESKMSTENNLSMFTSSSYDFEDEKDYAKMEKEFISEEKVKEKTVGEKTKWNLKKDSSRPSKNLSQSPKGSTVSSILKRVINVNDRHIAENYVQTTVIETVSKFTSTTKTDTCHILDCERNDRLLSEIRKFYKKRADLHNKHVFDDVILPRITLNEIMKYAELVLANQIMAATPTRHLQNAFQMKIIEWVKEIVSVDAWDDCMKCDIKLLSYELARYISEEKNSSQLKIMEKYNKETMTPEFINDQKVYGWYQPREYTNLVKISTSKIRGTGLNVQHFLDITPHKPGAICCASLKVWSVWIKDVAENAKFWCIWINQIITNMSYLSSIMRGEVYDKDGNQLILMTCDWKQFISNLDDDINAWRQYNNHIQSLTDQLTTAFHGKRITCCECCKNENLHISDKRIKHLYRRLFDAMKTTKNWRHWLQEMIDEAKQLTCISKDKCLCHIPIIEIVPIRSNENKNVNICDHTIGYPLVPYKEIFVEKDPSIYSIEHWITSELI